MKGWLALWGQVDEAVSDRRAAWMDVRQAPDPDLQSDFARLRGMRGPRFDVLFLRLLVQEHEDGLGMAAYAADHARLLVVRELASDIEAGLAAERDVVTAMLAGRGARRPR